METMDLKAATNYALERLTQVQLSKVLGVTPNQVYKYSSGETKSCRDGVVDAFYANLDILINYYENEAEYLKFRDIRKSV